MTVLLGRRYNGRPVTVTLAVGGGGGATNPVPPALTGINSVQLALPAGLVESAAGKFIVAGFEPIGGVGPFLYEVDPIDAGGFTAIGADGNRFVGQANRGRVVVPYGTGATASRTLKITDATGASATKAITIDISGGKAIYVGANRTFATNVDGYTVAIPVVPWTGSAVDGATLSFSDPSGFFGFYGGNTIALASASNVPPAGTYPITLSTAGYTSVTTNITVVAAACGTPYFVQTLSPISTSVLAGTVIGRIAATTPSNAFTVALSDPTGTLGVDGYNVIIAQQPANAGSVPFSFTVTDRGVSASSSAMLTVAQGTTLPSGNMNVAGLTTAFNNDTINNVLGTIPTPTGVTGTPTWTLVSQTGLNPLALQTEYGPCPARYQLDQSGKLTAPSWLSAGLVAISGGALTFPQALDTLVISCTDGINTCTRTVTVTVSWAPRQTIYIGPGMAAAHPGAGYDHLVDLRKAIAPSDTAPHANTYDVVITASADLNYYANDTGTPTSDYGARFPWPGPIVFRGMAGGGRSQPRLGGASAGNIAGGSDMRGKGFFTLGHGDAALVNLEISGCHDAIGDGSHGIDAITKDGLTYGNVSLLNCYLHDNDNSFKTGICHGIMLLDGNLIENGGTSYVSSGATHNAYVGEVSRLIFRNNVSRRSNNGYLLKTRAMVSEVYNNRFLDGLSGSSSGCIDLPFAGQVSVYGNVIEKGPMALGADVIRYGEEGYVWDTNTVSLHDNTISVLTLDGSHYGPPDVIWFVYGTNSKGVGATLNLASNALYLSPGSTVVKPGNSPPSSAIVINGTTTLARPPAIDATRPDLSGTLPATGPLYRHLSYGQDSFAHFDGTYQYQDRDQIQVASGATVGTTICALRASNQLGDQGAGTANPFGSGTTWSITTAPTYLGTTPWAAAGKYGVTANGDGSAALKVTGALTAGVDWVQLRASAPNGTVSDSRYAVVVTT